MIHLEKYKEIKDLLPENITLVAVSKTKPGEDIQRFYAQGQRDFGENKAQEMTMKYELLPKDIQWHFIGHLQSNKVKYIAPYVSLIHSIDSFELLKEVNKQALKYNRIIPCLLQFHIASEETKFGFDYKECQAMLENSTFHELKNVVIHGVMGMASFTDNVNQITAEFHNLSVIFQQLKTDYFKENQDFKEMSMGMTDDYEIAIAEGSTMVRIGSALFGSR